VRITSIVFMASIACVLAAQIPQAPKQPQQRDLRIEKEPPPPSPVREPSPELKTRKPIAIPHSYALVVGISHYENLPEKSQLRYSERDADLIYSILISPEGGNFRAEHVHKLVGSRATLANLKNELENWLPSVAKDDDRVLIYFAGHGFIFDGRAYLAPYDFQMKNAATTGYPMDRLGQVVGSKIKGKWKVLITDSCHSGAITPETSPELLNHSLLSLNKSLFSLTASRDRELSFESPDFGGGHGVFTYYVAKGMEGAADENGDGIVTADELGDYVRRNVREATNARQNPTSERGSYDPNMLLAYNPTGVRPEAPPAPKEGTLIFESNMDGVELFVDNNSQGILKKGEAFRLPGLQPGVHVIKAVKMGYEPDGPREEMVYPGQETTVKINILILRRRDKRASDALDKGIEYYTRGNEQNYRKAAEQFERALAIDPTYSTAAMYLGRTLNALYEDDKAAKAFQRAIAIDPDYLEARTSYAGMLMDIGNYDEAIRQLTVVTQRDTKNANAFYLLAVAFCRKEAYGQSIEAARQAIQLAPGNAEAHLWLAESLRLSGQYEASKPEYQQYLKLSDFDSKFAGKLNYWALGLLVGMGKKTRASQHDIWRDLRRYAYFGLCDADRKLQRWDAAIDQCQRALTYDPDDVYTHYALGLIYAHKFQESNRIEYVAAAEQQFRTVLTLNKDIEQADAVQKMLNNFAALLAKR
jgi:tetratricopeptide (TPR) repeat protein